VKAITAAGPHRILLPHHEACATAANPVTQQKRYANIKSAAGRGRQKDINIEQNCNQQ